MLYLYTLYFATIVSGSLGHFQALFANNFKCGNITLTYLSSSIWIFGTPYKNK